jgi:hypothetical protein
MIQDWYGQCASGRRSRQVSRIKLSGIHGEARQGDTYNDARENERNRNDRESQDGRKDLRFRIDWDVQLNGETDGAAYRKEQRRVRQCRMRIALLQDLDNDRARRKPEHGERNRHEREVIPHSDAEDSSQE